MSVQISANNTNVPFILWGETYKKDSETLAQDGARATDLAPFTVMAQIAATKKWEPLTDVAATDGTAIAKGIYLGAAIAFADIAAGDVVDLPILIGGSCTVASDQLVFENSLTLDTVVAAGVIEAHRIEDDLNEIGIFAEATVDIDGFEN